MPRSLTLLLNPRTNLRLITSAKSRERKEETRLGLTPLAHAQHNRENQEPNSRMTAFRKARLSLVLNERVQIRGSYCDKANTQWRSCLTCQTHPPSPELYDAPPKPPPRPLHG